MYGPWPSSTSALTSCHPSFIHWASAPLVLFLEHIILLQLVSAYATGSACNILHPDLQTTGTFLFRWQFKCLLFKVAFPDHPSLGSFLVPFAPFCFPQSTYHILKWSFYWTIDEFISIFAKKNVSSQRTETFSCSQLSLTSRIVSAHRRPSANVCLLDNSSTT